MPHGKVLYSDDCVDVTSEGVAIKWYWFPTAQSKYVPYESLRSVHSMPERTLDMFDSKGWGMGLGKTWWACGDLKQVAGKLRTRQDCNLVLESDSFYRHGFSVRDREAAFRAILDGLKAKGIEIPILPKGA
jgi:hypothetical protein